MLVLLMNLQNIKGKISIQDGRIHHFLYLLFELLWAIQWIFKFQLLCFTILTFLFGSSLYHLFLSYLSASLLRLYCFRHVHNCLVKILFYCLSKMAALKSLLDHFNISAHLVLALIVFFIQIKISLVINMKKELYLKYLRYSVTRS